MALSKKSIELVKLQNSGDGGILPKPEPDRTNRVLNYPGLEYFYKKLKTGGLLGGGSLYAKDIKLSDDVCIEITSWNFNEDLEVYINPRESGAWYPISDQSHYGARQVTQSEWNNLPEDEKCIDEGETGLYQVKKGYVWAVMERDVYYWLIAEFDKSKFEPLVDYDLIFCNSGDLPPSSYPAAESEGIYDFNPEFMDGCEWAIVIDIDNGVARFPVNRKLVEFKETHHVVSKISGEYACLVHDEEIWYQKDYANLDAPDKTFYMIFRKGTPPAPDYNFDNSWYFGFGYYDQEDNMYKRRFFIDRREGATDQPTGTPEENDVFIVNNMTVDSAILQLLPTRT